MWTFRNAGMNAQVHVHGISTTSLAHICKTAKIDFVVWEPAPVWARSAPSVQFVFVCGLYVVALASLWPILTSRLVYDLFPFVARRLVFSL